MDAALGALEAAVAERDAALRQAGERLAAQAERISEQGTEIDARAIELAGRERRIDELERVATRLSEHVVEREHEVRRLREALDRTREHGDETLATLATLAGELAAVRRQARGQATRIRLRALRDAVELSDRIAELAKRPPEARERLIGALVESIRRIGEAAEEAEREEAGERAAANGRPRGSLADVFEGLVEVEIGPLADFSQLVGFEDAAKSIAATSEISVKRFSEGRATLAMRLKEPVELLRELEERCDLEFAVRDLRPDRLVLDVGE